VSPGAEPDRRFYGFALDRLVAWSVDGLAAFLAWRFLIDGGRVAAGIAVTAGVVLLVYAGLAVLLGLTGSSPGNAALGLRVVQADGGGPIGVGPALLRQLVLGVATLPTFGIGTATLAWTATMDPSGRRHGWHDRIARSEVIDVRPAPDQPAVVESGPRHVVNLTAMRLVPAPSTPPPPPQREAARMPVPAPPPIPEPAVQRAPQHRATEPTAEPSPPRQQLGYPLVAEPAGPPARWRVSFDSGESFVVEGLTLIGRKPEPRAGEGIRQAVVLRSEDMSLSKTHAQIQVVADGVLVVMDRGSTNGSVLLRQGVTKDLSAGRPTTLLDGDHVRFGDRIMAVARDCSPER
jgi:hypothetical protein